MKLEKAAQECMKGKEGDERIQVSFECERRVVICCQLFCLLSVGEGTANERVHLLGNVACKALPLSCASNLCTIMPVFAGQRAHA